MHVLLYSMSDIPVSFALSPGWRWPPWPCWQPPLGGGAEPPADDVQGRGGLIVHILHTHRTGERSIKQTAAAAVAVAASAAAAAVVVVVADISSLLMLLLLHPLLLLLLLQPLLLLLLMLLIAVVATSVVDIARVVVFVAIAAAVAAFLRTSYSSRRVIAFYEFDIIIHTPAYYVQYTVVKRSNPYKCSLPPPKPRPRSTPW